MADMYAWSPIRGGTADKPVNIERGAKVKQTDLGVSDADWKALIDSGAIRGKPCPAPADYDGSVIDYLRDKLEEAQALSGVEVEEAASDLATVMQAGTDAAATEVLAADAASESDAGDKKK